MNYHGSKRRNLLDAMELAEEENQEEDEGDENDDTANIVTARLSLDSSSSSSDDASSGSKDDNSDDQGVDDDDDDDEDDAYQRRRSSRFRVGYNMTLAQVQEEVGTSSDEGSDGHEDEVEEFEDDDVDEDRISPSPLVPVNEYRQVEGTGISTVPLVTGVKTAATTTDEERTGSPISNGNEAGERSLLDPSFDDSSFSVISDLQNLTSDTANNSSSNQRRKSGDILADGEEGKNIAGQAPILRRSNSTRRSFFGALSDRGNSSRSLSTDPDSSQKRLSFETGNSDEDQPRRRVSVAGSESPPRYRRRSRFSSSAGSRESDEDGSSNSGNKGIMAGLKKNASRFSLRVSVSSDSSKTTSGGFGSMRMTSGSLDESTAAAAAAVSSLAQGPGRHVVPFGQGEYVLVQLSRLYVSEQSSDKDLMTVAPVNKLGYPLGEGKTEQQRQGPHKYVLTQVTKVHFDEDERYYTVRRMDTELEQRANPGFDWMIRIRNEEEIAIAMKAAKRCKRSIEENKDQENEKLSLFGKARARFIDYMEAVVTPLNSAKAFSRHLLRGDHHYALNVRFTGINLLVLSSFTYTFLDAIVLAFLDPRFDHKASIIGFTVWTILLLELIFEYAIRPSSYYELMQSDKAFAPATARHINWYHLLFETLALLLYIPQLPCAFNKSECGLRTTFSPINAALSAVNSNNEFHAAAGRFHLGLSYLRAFGLVRHWKQMWINHTFENGYTGSSLFRRLFLVEKRKGLRSMISRRKRKKQRQIGEDDLDTTIDEVDDPEVVTEQSKDDDRQLKNAATIGTALMLVNSHRALVLLLLIISIFPVIYTMDTRNPVAENLVGLLQANNVLSNTTSECDYLKSSVISWILTFADHHAEEAMEYVSEGQQTPQILWAQLLPIRCDWQGQDGIITMCHNTSVFSEGFPICDSWIDPPGPQDATPQYYAKILGDRPGALTEYISTNMSQASFCNPDDMESGMCEFYVRAIFNESRTVALLNYKLFLLLFCMIALVLVVLTMMREDAARLVLRPLQRMLKIVVRYAENPLSTPATKEKISGGDESEQLGHFETEQLINAIAKIADLLRKCWGVAGAGIISANLARTKSGRTVVFNPTIPGKRVYALFGFVGINEFDKQLRSLDKDVMKLINDVARVVHDEVYRWALGDSGQCNKNLGGAFLMVFRIGDFTEVHDRKKRATDVVFNTQMKKGVKVRQRGGNAMSSSRRNSLRKIDITTEDTLQLASLPGIQAFTDRAVLGFLKSFAGLHRDQNMQRWEKDFRLSAGVGTFKINVIYGMDAGWAVEGAVGSEYKIDATYLSPHVNMASRMMSACKQYGVKLLMSQAVEELLSKPARAMMRHLDTVYVKGSNVAQRIYTYDARFTGVDFFLFERSPEQADVDAESYSPSRWKTDKDLKSMRQHVSEAFFDMFKKGVDQYIEGEWTAAIKTLEDANYMMLKTVIEEGYVDYDYDEALEQDLLNMTKSNAEIDRIRTDYGDGACRCLLQYMQRRDGVPPTDWHGVRKLDSK